MKERTNLVKIFIYAIFIILIIALIFNIYAGIYYGVVLNILYLATFFIFIFKKSKIPLKIYFFLALLIILAVLGDFYFYNNIASFDKIIHFLSPLIICSLIFHLAKNKIKDKKILILFCIAVFMTVSVIWEITEYGLDNLVDSKMQGVYFQEGKFFDLYERQQIMVQSEIDDTMSDLIFNFLGSLAFGAIYFFINKIRQIKKVKRKDLKK